jgi:hypothetical protein
MSPSNLENFYDDFSSNSNLITFLDFFWYKEKQKKKNKQIL